MDRQCYQEAAAGIFPAATLYTYRLRGQARSRQRRHLGEQCILSRTAHRPRRAMQTPSAATVQMTAARVTSSADVPAKLTLESGMHGNDVRALQQQLAPRP